MTTSASSARICSTSTTAVRSRGDGREIEGVPRLLIGHGHRYLWRLPPFPGGGDHLDTSRAVRQEVGDPRQSQCGRGQVVGEESGHGGNEKRRGAFRCVREQREGDVAADQG